MSKNFLQTLAEINQGAVTRDLDDGLIEVLQAVNQTRTKGSITLTLSFKPGKGGRKLIVDPDVKIKAPKFEQGSDYFFLGSDLSLLRNDPDQHELPLRDVKNESNGPVIDPTTGEVIKTAEQS